jgi:ABC-type nitrate/sulfonate/bicarbonate transport system permease component
MATQKSAVAVISTTDENIIKKNNLGTRIRDWGRRNVHFLTNILSITLFLLVWELFSRFGKLSISLFPPPTWVAQEFWRMLQSGLWINDVFVSTKRVVSGYLLGSTIAIIIGLMTGRIPIVRALLEPVIQLLRPIPSIAWVSISIFWFGLGESSKLFLITYGVFFHVWLNTHVGVSTVDPVLTRAARSLGAKGYRLFFEVIMPAALPFIIAGLRSGMAVAFIVVVAAELIGASAGVGFRISHSREIFRADRMMVGLMTLGVLGGSADMLFSWLARRLVFWTGEGRK